MTTDTPPPDPKVADSRFKGFVRKRPVLSMVLASLLALLIGIGIGAAGTQSEVDDLSSENDSLQADLDDAEAEAEEARQDAADAEAENAPLRAKVAQVEDQKADLAKQQDQLDSQADDLASQAEDLDSREADLSSAEQTLESSTIPDGIWELGRDYEAGTYRAPGGGGCYWALLGSADTQDIINNGGFGENQTITIDSPYFESQDCGEWVKIE